MTHPSSQKLPRLAAWASCILCGIILLVSAVSPLTERPAKLLIVDNNIRSAVYIDNNDGDTARFTIDMGLDVSLVNTRVRLKDVRCYETADTDPVGQAHAQQEKQLLQSLLSGKDKPISIQVHSRDMYGRVVGTVFVKDQNINELMKQQPQGGR